MKLERFLDTVRNRTDAYRPIPFWSWNDQLEPDILREQIREMKQAGLGGYFMHARSGLKTPYLSDTWMQCIEAGIEEGQAQGLSPWIYDEEGWPSGFGGGLVPAQDSRFHARWMTFKQVPEIAETHPQQENCLYYGVSEAGYRCLSSSAETRLPGESLWQLSQMASPWYIDVCHPEAVACYIQVTHEAYARRFGDDFSMHARGFFTDEPRLFWNRSGDMPWSLTFENRYEAMWGEPLLPLLPLLFLPLPGWQRTRFRFWKMVSDAFVTAYMAQIGQWCTTHQCELTGHVMMEENIFTQLTGTGGVMPMYEHMHVPGMDWLRRMISSPIVPRQVSSVAAQLGKRGVLTETYALCGWNVNFEELRWMADWQLVHGVNLICQHLQGYSLKGLRKRDYPPSLFYQQSWWKEYSAFNDYLARMGALLSQGEEVADILLIHPMHSGWVLFDGTKNEAVMALDQDFEDTVRWLADHQYGCHFGDETLMARHGKVRDGALYVGACRYPVVVIPPAVSLDARTLELLCELDRQGGTVLAVNHAPDLCQGEPVTVDMLPAGMQVIGLASLDAALKKSVAPAPVRNPQGGAAEGIHLQQRRISGGTLLFVTHPGREGSCPVCINVESGFEAIQWLPETDETRKLPVVNGCADILLGPAQSVVVFLTEGSTPVDVAGVAPVTRLKNEWRIASAGLNSLTLDTVRWRVDEGPWQPPTAIIHLMETLLALQRPCDLEMETTFMIREMPEGEVCLVLEDADQFAVTLNGQTLPSAGKTWWKDRSFSSIPVSRALIAGENRLNLQCRFRQDPRVYEILFGKNVYETELNRLTYQMEIESMYLTGRFGVYSEGPWEQLDRGALRTPGPFVVTRLPAQVASGDLTRQGFLCFSEQLTLSQVLTWQPEQGTVRLDFGRPDCAMMTLRVNGKPAGKLLWQPFQSDITPLLVAGDNTIEVTLYASNRNLLGPHHHIRGEVYNVGPLSYTGKFSWVERETEAQVITDEDRTRNYWHPDYCFVRFGLEEN